MAPWAARLDAAAGRLRAAERALGHPPLHEAVGRITASIGPVLRVSGLQAALGHLVYIRTPHTAQPLLGEVAGFDATGTLVMPYGPTAGLGRDARVHGTGAPLALPLGDGLLGCVIDPLGRSLYGKPVAGDAAVPLAAAAPLPFDRLSITTQLPTGVRALDMLVPLGVGQRVGIFASAGSGKTTLLGMLARGCAADVVVIGLIGERGREVRDFIDENLGPEGLARSVVVAATSDRSALERIQCAHVATAVAEHFRAQGKSVLLLVDSLTRFARAQRELGLALGEPPTRRGFPPSLFAVLPQLLERPGRTRQGSITALYTVLMEDDNTADPVAEEVKSLLDGHIHLSPKISARGIYPAIDPAQSLSRLQQAICPAEPLVAARRFRSLWSRYLEVEMLIQIGEYAPGNDAATDEAVTAFPQLCALLRQDQQALTALGEAQAALRGLPGADAWAPEPGPSNAPTEEPDLWSPEKQQPDQSWDESSTRLTDP